MTNTRKDDDNDDDVCEICVLKNTGRVCGTQKKI